MNIVGAFEGFKLRFPFVFKNKNFTKKSLRKKLVFLIIYFDFWYFGITLKP